MMKRCYTLSSESKRADHPSSAYKGALLLPKPSCSSVALLGHGRELCPPSSSSSTSSSTDARAAAALRIHSLAEKKRRDRINTHLATLRRMIPSSTNKMDKASLLGRVIDQVRELNRNAANISKASAIPSEMNQVIVECDNERRSPFSSYVDENVQIKASLCCDDRPDLFSDLMHAFHTLKLTAIRAELSSVGGRAQNVFTLCMKDGNGKLCLSSLMESIRKVLTKIVSSEEAAFTDQSGKRQRFLATNYSNMIV